MAVCFLPSFSGHWGNSVKTRKKQRQEKTRGKRKHTALITTPVLAWVIISQEKGHSRREPIPSFGNSGGLETERARGNFTINQSSASLLRKRGKGETGSQNDKSLLFTDLELLLGCDVRSEGNPCGDTCTSTAEIHRKLIVWRTSSGSGNTPVRRVKYAQVITTSFPSVTGNEMRHENSSLKGNKGDYSQNGWHCFIIKTLKRRRGGEKKMINSWLFFSASGELWHPISQSNKGCGRRQRGEKKKHAGLNFTPGQ